MQQRIKRIVVSFTVATIIAFLLLPINITHAEITDGYYEIDYEVLSADNDSVSVANDYFDKPATLIVEDGHRTIQISINHSEWVVGLQAPQEDNFVDVDTVKLDDANDVRVVQFQVEEDHDLVDPIEMKMHIIVDVLDEEYDHHYSARFAFDQDSIEEIKEAEVENSSDAVTEKQEESADEAVENEDISKDVSEVEDEEMEGVTEGVAPSGMNAGTLIVIILLASITVILLYSFVFKKKK